MSESLNIQKIGSPANPSLICLHGFMGSGADFQFLTDSLAGHFYIILPDLPGHGASRDFKNNAQWSIPFCSAALADSLRPFAPIHLLGYSLGGRVAMTLAVNEPSLLSSLIVESATPGIEDPQQRRERTARDDRLAGQLQKKNLTDFLDDWYRQPLFKDIGRLPGFNNLYRRRLQNSPGHLARALSEMSSGRMPGLWARLANITCPTLLINGDQDVKYAAISARMQKTNPSFRRSEARGAGHNVHFSKPDWYIKQLSDFLRGLL